MEVTEMNYQDREDMIQIRIKTKESYQIKRILDAIQKDKGFVLMSRSEIKRVKGPGPRLRIFASLKDLKEEKKNNRKKKSK